MLAGGRQGDATPASFTSASATRKVNGRHDMPNRDLNRFIARIRGTVDARASIGVRAPDHPAHARSVSVSAEIAA